MSATFESVRDLIQRGEVVVSAHGYDELEQDDIAVHDVLAGIGDARLVEDYPDYARGACTLVLQHDRQGDPIHVVWGIPRGKTTPAVLVTAYRPDPARWSADFMRRAK